jgi:hypothetical protein
LNAFWHLARFNAFNCMSAFWSSVETGAQPYFMTLWPDCEISDLKHSNPLFPSLRAAFQVLLIYRPMRGYYGFGRVERNIILFSFEIDHTQRGSLALSNVRGHPASPLHLDLNDETNSQRRAA